MYWNSMSDFAFVERVMFEGHMRTGCAKAAVLLLLMVCSEAGQCAQDLVASVWQKSTRPNAVRVIQDPHTSMCWLLERDPARPGGPGRMVLLGQQESSQSNSASIAQVNAKINQKINASILTPVIRSGDRVILEENSAIVEARLEAVAMGSAKAGGELNVRLAIGGKILRAKAIGPGLVAFAADAGALK
jgi:hypothetical protein